MEEIVYKYRFDRRTLYTTAIYIAILTLLGILLYLLYEGGYLSAWFTSFIVALIALMALSIPRKIVVDSHRVSIRCLLDLTEIRMEEIGSVRRVQQADMRWMLPLFGVRGFLGYFGYFLDLKRFERVRIYASEWRNFVEIIDIYEERFYVSCRDADQLVQQIARYIPVRPQSLEEKAE